MVISTCKTRDNTVCHRPTLCARRGVGVVLGLQPVLRMIVSGLTYNLYALFRKTRDTKEVIYDISEVEFSKDDSADERVLRLKAGG